METVVVILVVALAGAVAGRRLYRALQAKSCGCGMGGCPRRNAACGRATDRPPP